MSSTRSNDCSKDRTAFSRSLCIMSSAGDASMGCSGSVKRFKQTKAARAAKDREKYYRNREAILARRKQHYLENKAFGREANRYRYAKKKQAVLKMVEITMPEIKRIDLPGDWPPNSYACHQDLAVDPLELPASDPLAADSEDRSAGWQIKTGEFDISLVEFRHELVATVDTHLQPHPSTAVLGKDTGALVNEDCLVHPIGETVISQTSGSAQTVQEELTPASVSNSLCLKRKAGQSCNKKIQPGNKTSKMLKCYICREEFSSVRSLNKHKLSHYSAKRYECEICNKNYASESYLQEHKAIHMDFKPYQCEKCLKKFFTKYSLRSHMVSHSDLKPYGCEKCDKKYAFKSRLKKHEATHSKPIECTICTKKFSTKTCLKEHNKIHADLNPYQCEKCLKKFTSKYSIKVHMASHSGIKPYECEKCAKKFALKSILKQHEAVHTKPFECAICGKKFSSKSTLTNHILTHLGKYNTKRFECIYCDKTFSGEIYIKSHMATHSGLRPYECTICAKRFSTMEYFRMHKATHTN